MFPYNPILEEQSKYLRENLSQADKVVAKVLKEKFAQLSFEIKVPVDDYIIDFFIPEKKVFFEIDSGQQENTDAYVYHAERKERLASLYLKVYRLDEKMILNTPEELIKLLNEYLK